MNDATSDDQKVAFRGFSCAFFEARSRVFVLYWNLSVLIVLKEQKIKSSQLRCRATFCVIDRDRNFKTYQDFRVSGDGKRNFADVTI